MREAFIRNLAKHSNEKIKPVEVSLASAKNSKFTANEHLNIEIE